MAIPVDYNLADQETRARIQAFIREASQITTNKIFFNKEKVKRVNYPEQCFEEARKHLGKDIGFLVDVGSVCQYISDVFGSKNLRLFEDGISYYYSTGTHLVDMDHALLLYYKLLSENSDLTDKALGLLYYLAGHQLDTEFTQISKVAPRSQITPAFELDAKLFRWKRCNFVLRKYMLELSCPEGYKAYYFEKKRLGQISYLMTTGHTFDSADELTRNSTGGLFYSYLPIEIENYLIPSILSGHCVDTEMDGMLKQNLIRDTATIAADYTIDGVYNVYNMMAKQYMVEALGMLIDHIGSDMLKNEDLLPSDARVYHLSPLRIGIIIKEHLNIEDVLPSLHGSFKPVEPLSIENIVKGEFL